MRSILLVQHFITLLVLCFITFHLFQIIHPLSSSSFLSKDNEDSYSTQRRNLRKLVSSFSSSPLHDEEFPDPQLALELSELTVNILDIGPNLSPEEAIPSKYKIHLWIETESSTEVLIVTYREKSNIFVMDNKNDIDLEDNTSSDKIIVMFRGSEDLSDWLANVNVMMDESKFVGAPKGVEVHRGYQNALFSDDIPQQIEETIFNLLNNTSLNLSQEIIYSGHSLGGTLAHMMAIYFCDKYNNMQSKLISFGAPRFGNTALKSWVKEKLPNLSAWRFVYRKDFAPRAVPRVMGYTHTGHLYQLEESTSAAYYDQTGSGKEFRGAPSSWYNDISFMQHNSYVPALKESVSNAKFWSRDFERCKWWMVNCWFK